MIRIVPILVAALVVAGCSGGSGGSQPPKPGPGQAAPGAPAPDEPLPSGAEAFAARLASVDAVLRGDIERFGAGRGSVPPQELQLRALYEQRAYRWLARRPALTARVLPRLPRTLRRRARDSVAALRDLFRLTAPANEHRFKTQTPLPPGRLRGFYAEAQRRFRVGWSVLAAVNLVESNFGRLKNTSIAGAQGPMQFIPATWRAFGMGGNVHDPHDAILGAANYLRNAGAPGDYTRALFSYNNSYLYVDAVQRLARRMNSDYVTYWSWQVFVRTKRGDVRLTTPTTSNR